VTEAVGQLTRLSGGNLQALLFAINERVFGKKSKGHTLKDNITSFCDIYLSSFSERTRAASILTQGLPLKEAHQISGVPVTSLSRGRSDILSGIFWKVHQLKCAIKSTWGVPTPAFHKSLFMKNIFLCPFSLPLPPSPSPFLFQPIQEEVEVRNEEKEWFSSFVLELAPTTSGRVNERRLPYSTWISFYRECYQHAAKMKELSVRSIRTVIEWTKALKVKRAIFDRYKCEKCFEGRLVEANVIKGNASAEDNKCYEEYKEHRDLIKNQFNVAKTHKAISDEDTLVAIYDYTTFHEYSDVKMRDLGFYFLYKGEKFFVDNLAAHAHDFHFTWEAWRRTLTVLKEEKGIELGKTIKKIYIWADGGLKTKENLFFFHCLAKAKCVKVEAHFFAPHHGHSEVSSFL
jgi:hypothetical protein